MNINIYVCSRISKGEKKECALQFQMNLIILHRAYEFERVFVGFVNCVNVIWHCAFDSASRSTQFQMGEACIEVEV